MYDPYRRCKCPVWVEGTKDDGEYVASRLKLSSWERAEDRKRELEAGSPGPATSSSVVSSSKRTSVREAAAEFYAECQAPLVKGKPTMPFTRDEMAIRSMWMLTARDSNLPAIPWAIRC